MRRLLFTVLIAVTLISPILPPVVFAAPVVKEGLSYSIPDCNFEQVTLLEVWKQGQLSANVGFRSNDTVLASVGYDLGDIVAPAKTFISSTAILKAFAPILNLINPSVDLYAGSKILRDNSELVLNQSEMDYGLAVTAVSIKF